MTPNDFAWLLSDPGQTLLHQAMQSDLRDSQRLNVISQLRKHATPAQAALAYEMAWLRERAAAKFANAPNLYFVREALEQASGETIARYRAQRFAPFPRIGDFCCGIGGDTLALAQHTHVFAVDNDPLRLAMAQQNAHANQLSARIEFNLANLESIALNQQPKLHAIFFDPARRKNGQRVFALKDYAPPIALVNTWRKHVALVGVKVAPGISDTDVKTLGTNADIEFISVDGELKEAVLWFEQNATSARRATLLHQGNIHTLVAHRASLKADVSAPRAFLYEPDPAVIRAHAVADLALELGATQLSADIAYLTSDQPTPTPFARCWRVLAWLPFQLKNLRAALRNFETGVVTVKKRGSPLDTDALAKQLSGNGTRERVVVLTQLHGKPIALICEGPI